MILARLFDLKFLFAFAASVVETSNRWRQWPPANEQRDGEGIRISLLDRRLDLGHVGILADEMMRDAHGVADRLDDAHPITARLGRQTLGLMTEQSDHHADRLHDGRTARS